MYGLRSRRASLTWRFSLCCATLASPPPPADAEADALRDCLAWAQARGAALLNGVSISPVSAGGRGIVAGTSGTSVGDALVSVPASLLLTCTTARASSPLLAAAAAQLRPEALLALHLLYEVSKGVDSHWAPYLRALPRTYSDGAGFSAAEASALQAPHAVAACEEVRRVRRADWAAAAPAMQALALPPRFAAWAAWSWAASTVGSRTVYYAEGGPPSAGALCPIGDCFNHAACADGTASGGFAYDAQADAVVFAAHTHTPPGEQVFITYGEHSNLDLVLQYGFSPGGSNPHERALLPRGPHLDALCLEDEELRVDPSGAPGWRLLAALRLAAAPAVLRRRSGHTAASGDSLGFASDAAAFARLRLAAADALAALPTTAEEDEVLLAAEAPGTRLHLAIAWRLQHKRTLQRAVRLADERVAQAQAALRDAASCTLVRP